MPPVEPGGWCSSRGIREGGGMHLSHDVVVVGSGVAGLSVARRLSDKGLSVLVIERTGKIGGTAWSLGCKATFECLGCGICRIVEQKRELESRGFPGELKTNTGIAMVRRQGKDFLLETDTGDIQTRFLVVATGIEPYPAHNAANFGCDIYPEVFSGYDLEKTLNEEGLDRYESFERVAFIQCVGSRSVKEKRGYCSQVCCRYALRLCENLKYRFPHMIIDMYYMDLQMLGEKKDTLARIARERVNLFRHMPFRVEREETEDGFFSLALRFEDPQRVTRSSYDAVVLSVGMIASGGTLDMARKLQLTQDRDGFIKNLGEGKTSTPGIFVTGGAWGPTDVEGSLRDAVTTAETVLAGLKEDGP